MDDIKDVKEEQLELELDEKISKTKKLLRELERKRLSSQDNAKKFVKLEEGAHRGTKTEPVYVASSDEEDSEVQLLSSKEDSSLAEADDSVSTVSNKESEFPEEQPVFERPVKGYTAGRLLNIIIGCRVKKEKISKRVPRGIREHSAFVVDTKCIGCTDIISYGDDNGSWRGHSKSRRRYQFQIPEDVETAKVEEYHSSHSEELPTDVYTLCRNYFRHTHTPEFRKVISTVYDHSGNMLPLAVVQYFFEGGVEVPIKLPSHGNAKREDAEPYMRTSRPVLRKIQEKCKTKSCKKAVDECYEEGGGSVGCKSVADVPRNRKQAYNLNVNKREVNTAKRHEFYDVLELLNKGTFVRDFGFAKSSVSQRTQPRSFQATNRQLSELSRVCLSQRYTAILGIDATFNCGSFYVTLTSYQHKMFVSKASGRHPVIVGPSIIHTSKEFEDDHYLATQLKVHCKGFESLKLFGTDGEINLVNAFVCELPEALHLRCKIHLADNIERKLKALSFEKDAMQQIMHSIFGRRSGNTREKGLADAASADEFDQMLEDVKSKWCEVESVQHGGKPEFHSWFQGNLGQVIQENVIAPIREIAGLGSPPEFYTQNVAECCNSMVKGDAGTKLEWSDFCLSVEDTAEQQERELQKAVHQMGEYRLAPDFKHLEVRTDKWLKMTPDQRETHLKRCFSNPLDKLGRSDDDEAELINEQGEGNLSVTYEESGVTTVSRSNLRQMWCYATKILNQHHGIMAVPWDSTGSQKVVFDGEGKQPCHVQVSGSTIKCGCPKYKSTMMCSHSLAVAEHESCLPQFLSIVRKKKKLPDPHRLVENNLPRSAGKKSGERRKGRANATQQPLMAVHSSSSTMASTATTAATAGSMEDSYVAASALVALSGGTCSNNENFALKEFAGTQVRVCYGCGQIIRVPPEVPPPPHDLCIVNKEYRVYKADGAMKISNDRQNCHYHLYTRCVQLKHKDFIPSMVKVPEPLRPKLTAAHWAWLEKEFQMFL